MNIDELTIGQAKELATMFASEVKEPKPPMSHPLIGKKVVAVLPNGFIHFGTLQEESGTYSLNEASNLRYWKQRDGGLPEFAKIGPKNDDRIDVIGTVYFDSALFFYPIGDWQ